MLRKVLIISLLCFSYLAEAQSVGVMIQSYTDRCTGATQVFQVPMNGATVITFYDQSRSFTSQDFQNGTLQSWLEGVYLSWSQLNPCSENQAENNVIQNTVQQTTQAATQAATQATASVPTIPQTDVSISTPTPPAPTPVATATVDTPAVEVQAPTVESAPAVDNTAQPVESAPSNESAPGGTETTENTNTESQGTTESSETETAATESTETQEDSSSSSESTDEGATEDNGGDSGDGETSEENQESEVEESSEESSEETTEESSEEESSEESSEEESSEEESSEEEESTEEESEEESSDEEESEEESSEESEEESEEGEKKKKKKKKKRASAPPIIVANVSSMQNIDGTFQQAFTMGLSKSSLKGDKSYGLNAMVWQNLKQYMLMGSFSKVFFKEGRPFMVYSAGIGASKMFTTVIGMTNHSLVLLGKKGMVVGTSLGLTSIYLNYDVTRDAVIFDDNIISNNITGFFTKPYNFSRITISPMLAVSKQLINYNVYSNQTGVNKDFMYITGSNFDFALTKRFKANLGVNLINSTSKEIRSTLTITIGSRFTF